VFSFSGEHRAYFPDQAQANSVSLASYPVSSLLSGPLGGLIIQSQTTINPDGTKSQDFMPLILYTAALLTVGGAFFVSVRVIRGRGKPMMTKM
jgi:hypothetical protein